MRQNATNCDKLQIATNCEIGILRRSFDRAEVDPTDVAEQSRCGEIAPNEPIVGAIMDGDGEAEIVPNEPIVGAITDGDWEWARSATGLTTARQ
jgi:hypothetical protein